MGCIYIYICFPERVDDTLKWTEVNLQKRQSFTAAARPVAVTGGDASDAVTDTARGSQRVAPVGGPAEPVPCHGFNWEHFSCAPSMSNACFLNSASAHPKFKSKELKTAQCLKREGEGEISGGRERQLVRGREREQEREKVREWGRERGKEKKGEKERGRGRRDRERERCSGQYLLLGLFVCILSLSLSLSLYIYIYIYNRVYCMCVGLWPFNLSFLSFSFLIGWEFYGPNYLKC